MVRPSRHLTTTQWFKRIGDDRLSHYRSSGSTERAVAEDMLQTELERKAKGLAPAGRFRHGARHPPCPKLTLPEPWTAQFAAATSSGNMLTLPHVAWMSDY